MPACARAGSPRAHHHDRARAALAATAAVALLAAGCGGSRSAEGDGPSARWNRGRWFDDRTVVGVAAPTRGSPTLVPCRVPGGACTPVEGTTGRVLQLPVGSAGSEAVTDEQSTARSAA